MADGPDAILADIRQAYAEGFAAHNGWLVSRAGRYGTNYKLRASVAQIGLGALTPDESIYPLAQVDHTGQDLTGAKRYVMHFDPGQLPPARAFWSVSLYDLDGFFVPNPIDRYLINDRTDLHFNPDGSLDVYIQHEEPSSPVERQNWLPAPTGDLPPADADLCGQARGHPRHPRRLGLGPAGDQPRARRGDARRARVAIGYHRADRPAEDRRRGRATRRPGRPAQARSASMLRARLRAGSFIFDGSKTMRQEKRRQQRSTRSPIGSARPRRSSPSTIAASPSRRRPSFAPAARGRRHLPRRQEPAREAGRRAGRAPPSSTSCWWARPRSPSSKATR